MEPWVYIVIAGLAIIGYSMMKPQSNRNDPSAVASDIETALDQFAQDLDEDNEQLLQSIAGLKRELEAEINKLNGRVEAIEKQSVQMNVVSAGLVAGSSIDKPKTRKIDRKPILNELPTASAALKEDEPVESELVQETKEPELNIKNRYASIFELHEQGKSIEYIAKKTGMNKGEVQLIIQLARQEAQFRD